MDRRHLTKEQLADLGKMDRMLEEMKKLEKSDGNDAPLTTSTQAEDVDEPNKPSSNKWEAAKLTEVFKKWEKDEIAAFYEEVCVGVRILAACRDRDVLFVRQIARLWDLGEVSVSDLRKRVSEEKTRLNKKLKRDSGAPLVTVPMPTVSSPAPPVVLPTAAEKPAVVPPPAPAPNATQSAPPVRRGRPPSKKIPAAVVVHAPAVATPAAFVTVTQPTPQFGLQSAPAHYAPAVYDSVTPSFSLYPQARPVMTSYLGTASPYGYVQQYAPQLYIQPTQPTQQPSPPSQ
jgi:hypothetical protein